MKKDIRQSAMHYPTKVAPMSSGRAAAEVRVNGGKSFSQMLHRKSSGGPPAPAPLLDDREDLSPLSVNFKGTVITDLLYNLHRKSTRLIDTHVICQDGYIPVHRCVLMAASKLLRPILAQEDPAELASVSLPDYTVRQVLPIINSFYTGSTLFKQDALNATLELIQLLQADHGTTYTFQPAKPGDKDLEPKMRHYANTRSHSRRSSCTSRPKSRSSERTPRLDQICGNYAVDEEPIFVPSEPNSGAASPAPDSLVFEPEDHLEEDFEESHEGTDDQEEVGDNDESNDSVNYNVMSEMNILGLDIEEVDGDNGEQENGRQTGSVLSSLEMPATEFDPAMVAKTVVYAGEDSAGSTSVPLGFGDDYEDSFEINLVNNVLVRPDVLKDHLNKGGSMEDDEDDLMSTASSPGELETVFAQESTSEKPPRVINGRHYTEIQTTTFDEFGERPQIAQIITEPSGSSSENCRNKAGPKSRIKTSSNAKGEVSQGFKVPNAPTKKSALQKTLEMPTFHHARIKVNPESKAAEKQKRHEDILFSMQLQENLLKGLAAIEADGSDSAVETDVEDEARSPSKSSDNSPQKQMTPSCSLNLTGSKQTKGQMQKDNLPKLASRTATPSSATPPPTKSKRNPTTEKSKKKSSSEVLALVEACNLVGGFLGPSSTRSSRSTNREAHPSSPTPAATVATTVSSQKSSRTSSFENDVSKVVEKPLSPILDERGLRRLSQTSELSCSETQEIPAPARSNLIIARRSSSSSTNSTSSSRSSVESRTRSKSRESLANSPAPEGSRSRKNSKSSDVTESSPYPAEKVSPNSDEALESLVEKNANDIITPSTATVINSVSTAAPEVRPTLTKGALKQVTVVESINRKRSQTEDEDEAVIIAKRPNIEKQQVVEIIEDDLDQPEVVKETSKRRMSSSSEILTPPLKVHTEGPSEVIIQNAEPPNVSAEPLMVEATSEGAKEITTPAAEPCIAEEAEIRTAIAKQLQESVKRLEDLAAKDYFSDPETCSPPRMLENAPTITQPFVPTRTDVQESSSADVSNDTQMEAAEQSFAEEPSSGNKSGEDEDQTEEELNRQIELNMQRLGSAAPILPINNEQRTPKSTKFFEEFVKKKFEKLQATEETKKDEVSTEDPSVADVEDNQNAHKRIPANSNYVVEDDFDDGAPGTTIIEGYEIVDYIPDAENEIVVENEVSVGEEEMADEYKMSFSPPPTMVLPQQSRPGLIPDIQSSGSILRLKLKPSPEIQANSKSVEVESLFSDPEEEEEPVEGSVPLSHIANALEAYPTRAFQTEHDGLTYVIRNPTIVCNRLSTEKLKEKLKQMKITARPESPPPPLLTKVINSSPSPPSKCGKSPPTLTISISGNSAFVKNRQNSSGHGSHYPPKLDVYGHKPHQEFRHSNSQPKPKSARSLPSASLSISPVSFGNYPVVAQAQLQPPSITGNDIEWYRKQLKQCPHCRKKYKSHKNATYCLGLHGYRRCIICLDLLKNHDTSYEQHLAKYHEVAKGLVNCPICSQPYHVTGLITHVDRKHLRTPPNAESIPLPLPSPPLWTVRKDKNNKPRTYNNNNNSKRPKPALPNLFETYRPPYAQQHYQVYQQNEKQERKQSKQPQPTQNAFLLKSSSLYTSKGPMLSDDEDEENNPKTLSGYMTETQRKQFAFKLFKPYDATKDLEAVIDQNIVTLAIAKKAFGIVDEVQQEVEEIPEEQSYGVYDRIREERAEVVAEIAQLEAAATSSNVNVDFEKPPGNEFVQQGYPTYSNMTLNYSQEWAQCSQPIQQSYNQQQVASCNNNYYQPPAFNQQTFDQQQYGTGPPGYEEQQNTTGQPQPYSTAYAGNEKQYSETSGEHANAAQHGRTLEEQIADQDFDTPIPEDLSHTTATEEIVETVIEPEEVRLNIVDPPYSDQQLSEAVSTIQPTSPEAPSSPQGPTPAQDFPLDELNQQDQPSDLSMNGQHSAELSHQAESSLAKSSASSTRLPDMPQILETTASGIAGQPQMEYLLGSVTVSVTRQRSSSVDTIVTSSGTTTTATNFSENASKSTDDRISSPSKQTEQTGGNIVRNPSPSPTEIAVTTSPPTLQSLLGDDKSSDSYATATLIYEAVTPTPEDLTESSNNTQRSSSGSLTASQQPVITTTAAAIMSAAVSDEFDISRYISTSIVPNQQPATVSTAEASVITSHQSKRHNHHQIADIIQQPKKRYIQQFTDVPDYQAYLNQASAYGNMHNLGNMHFGAHPSASSFSSRHTPINLHQSAAHHYDALPHHHSTGYTSSTHSHHRSSGSSSSHHHHQHHSSNPYNLSSSAAASYHSQHLQISPYSSSTSHYRHQSGSSSGYHGRGDKMPSASHHHSSNIHVDESGSLLCELTPVRSSYSNSLRYLATNSSALKAVGASSSAYDVSSATAIDASTRPSLFATPPLGSLHHQEAAAALLSNPIGYTTYNPEDSYRRSVSSSSAHSSNSASTTSSSSGGSHGSMAHHDISHLSATWGTTIRTVDSNQTVRPFDYGEELDGHGPKASIQCERCRQHFHLAAFNDHKCNY